MFCSYCGSEKPAVTKICQTCGRNRTVLNGVIFGVFITVALLYVIALIYE